MLPNVNKFIYLSKLAECICDSDIEWETKHNLIFSEGISKSIYKTKIEFHWCDLDSSYQEEVLNFVSGVKEKRQELEKLLPMSNVCPSCGKG